MANGALQSQEDLQEHLADQINFLELSANAYDSGFTGEAKRMAVSLRVLLHDTPNSRSLLGQLNRKNTQFYDSASPINPSNKATHSGLVGILVAGGEGKPIAFLDDNPRGSRQANFESWWETPVFVDSKGQVLTRKDLVLTVADQDGGAHVDPKLEERYAELSRHNSMGWFHISGTPIKEVERAAIRQITHEVLKTLRPGYAKNLVKPEDGFIVANMQIEEASNATPRAQSISRNELCPCGSGKKYKMCHGKPESEAENKRKHRKRHNRKSSAQSTGKL